MGLIVKLGDHERGELQDDTGIWERFMEKQKIKAEKAWRKYQKRLKEERTQAAMKKITALQSKCERKGIENSSMLNR